MTIKSIKIRIFFMLCASALVVQAIPATTNPSVFVKLKDFVAAQPKAVKVAAVATLGAYHLIYNVFDPVFSYFYYINEDNAHLLEYPTPYKKQPASISELQELLQGAIQEDMALMGYNLENPYIAAYLQGMSKTELRNHSRLGSITLAKAKKTNKDGKPTIAISWAAIPGLSEQQVQQLNQLQYQYVKEFYHAISPEKKSYEISSIKKDIFGKKTGIYYYAPTMQQKRKAQEMHMQQAFSTAKTMFDMLGEIAQTERAKAPTPVK